MAIIEFIVFYSWMNVAMSLLNPLGEDDDDFESSWLIDRNLAIGLTMVDKAYGSAPNMEKDAFFDRDIKPIYRADSKKEGLRRGSPQSTALVKVRPGTKTVRMVSIDETGKQEDEALVIVSANSVMDGDSELARKRRVLTFGNSHGAHNFSMDTIVQETEPDEMVKNEKKKESSMNGKA